MVKKLQASFITLIVAVIGIQLLGAAVQPYLGWIGRTAALVIIVLLIGAAAVAVAAIIKYVSGRFGGGGTFNG